MDEEYGFIREKLDIKLLILYILRRLSGGVDISTIFEICRVDGGVGYFDYSDCLSELTETGLIAYDEDNGRWYNIQGQVMGENFIFGRRWSIQCQIPSLRRCG